MEKVSTVPERLICIASRCLENLSGKSIYGMALDVMRVSRLCTYKNEFYFGKFSNCSSKTSRNMTGPWMPTHRNTLGTERRTW
jgi:hypothetical protein